MYTRDHTPPHFHIRVSDTAETRYLWPELRPFDGDPRLTGTDEKAFRKYWSIYGGSIAAKLRLVYQRGAG